MSQQVASGHEDQPEGLAAALLLDAAAQLDNTAADSGATNDEYEACEEPAGSGLGVVDCLLSSGGGLSIPAPRYLNVAAQAGDYAAPSQGAAGSSGALDYRRLLLSSSSGGGSGAGGGLTPQANHNSSGLRLEFLPQAMRAPTSLAGAPLLAPPVYGSPGYLPFGLNPTQQQVR